MSFVLKMNFTTYCVTLTPLASSERAVARQLLSPFFFRFVLLVLSFYFISLLKSNILFVGVFAVFLYVLVCTFTLKQPWCHMC